MCQNNKNKETRRQFASSDYYEINLRDLFICFGKMELPKEIY